MTLLNSFLLSVAFIGAVGCSSTGGTKSSAVDNASIGYSDIDIYHLKGIGPIKERRFPQIYIADSGVTTKNVSFCYDEKHLRRYRFTYENQKWASENETTDEGEPVILLTWIYPDKVLWLTYTSRNGHPDSLKSVSKLQKNVETRYVFKTMLKVDPDKMSDDLISKLPLMGLSVNTYVQKGRFLHVVNSIDNYSVDYHDKNQGCYDVGVHSAIWWIMFRNYIDLKTIRKDCK